MASSDKNNISHKTDAVMKLLTGGNLAVNPMLDNEFKQSVIEMRSSQAAKEEEILPAEPKEITMHSGGEEAASRGHGSTPEICVSSELISEILPIALKRFGCCTCGKCFAEAMAEAIDMIPYISVKVKNSGDLKKADEMKRSSRREVMREIVRITIARRKMPKHNAAE
jgi:hypothetical protein